MRLIAFIAGVALSMAAVASGPTDFAREWPVVGRCGAGSGSEAKPEVLRCEGAFAVTLDESVYRQVTRADLSDLAAYNGDGEALPFGPMPAQYTPPPGTWKEAAWFALPAPSPGEPSDLHLHVTRTTTGELSLDATLSHGPTSQVQDILVDVRAPQREVEEIELELAVDAPDFSADLSVEASDDLQQWRLVVPSATIAQLRQGGQTLLRRHVEFAPQSARYLRLHVLGATGGVPLNSVRLLLNPIVPAGESLKRSSMLADFVRRDGKAYVYRLPARVPVERVNIALGSDNAIASFSISARDDGGRNWNYVGQLDAFRLRAAGVSMDNEAMDIGTMRSQEWRIEPSMALDHTPSLELSYRPERWLLLTHGAAPFVVAAGSGSMRRNDFPLEALVTKVRAKFGKDWQPPAASLGVMANAGGDDALVARVPGQARSWLLWSVLLLAAGVIVAMVLRLLRAPPAG